MSIDNLRKQWNEACLSAGIPAISTDKAARILAIVYVAGNNEEMVLNPQFNADLKYIQARWHIDGGETPDPSILPLLKQYIKELEDYEENAQRCDSGYKRGADKRPQWEIDLLASYGITAIN